MVRARLFTAIVVLAGIAATVLAVWPARPGRAGSSQTVAATRGDVVVTVGGVGRVVEARGTTAPIAVPAATPGTAAAATPTAPTAAPPDSVFPTASGRVVRFLVAPGRSVRAGQAIAVLDDGNASLQAVAQARTDAASARLELRQKQTSDPAKGLPPTPAELRSARAALRAAKERARLVVHPAAADVVSARLDVRKAESDLAALVRPPGAEAVAAATLAVAVAVRRLGQASGPPSAVDVAAAQTELAKAQADLDALLATPPGPTAAAVQAAQLAVALAQQRIAELPADAPTSDRIAAQLDLKRAQAELEALQAPPAPAARTAVVAAQAAVALATKKLEQLTGPPSPVTIASARLDLLKARADLETLRRRAAPQAITAARLAVALAHRRLHQLVEPGAAARDTARADAAKAAADLQTLLLRGGPAGPLDIAIARLKVAAADERVAAAELQKRRLVVRTPFAGTVTGVLTERGAPADPTTPIATVADLHHLAVNVDLSEFDVARVRTGQRAVLAVDAFGGRKLPGRVIFVAYSGNDSGGVITFPVRVTFARTEGVKPGMNVSVRIVVARRRGVVQVPLEAVHGSDVTVVGSGGTQTERHVRLGLADSKAVEITSGLRAGEHVLLPSSGG